MTLEEYQALKSLIESDAEASLLFAIPDDGQCAEQCKLIAPKVSVATRRTYLSLASKSGIGPDATRRLVVSVRAVAAIDPLVDELQIALRRSKDEDGIDISDVGTQGMLEMMAGLKTENGLMAGDVEAIKSLCLVSQNITALDVEYVRTRL